MKKLSEKSKLYNLERFFFEERHDFDIILSELKSDNPTLKGFCFSANDFCLAEIAGEDKLFLTTIFEPIDADQQNFAIEIEDARVEQLEHSDFQSFLALNYEGHKMSDKLILSIIHFLNEKNLSLKDFSNYSCQDIHYVYYTVKGNEIDEFVNFALNEIV